MFDSMFRQKHIYILRAGEVENEAIGIVLAISFSAIIFWEILCAVAGDGWA
jgi:hypothetical protein